MKKYSRSERRLPPKPRAEALRGAGAVYMKSAPLIVGGAAPSEGGGGSGHEHGNLAYLESILGDADNYQWRFGEKMKAGYADVAGELSPDSPTRREFLSRLEADEARGLIRFLAGLASEGLAALKGGAQFGEFTGGMWGGFGGAIDARGNAELESLRVRSSLEVLELVINRLSALEGDQLLTEADTIDEAEDLGGGRWRLKLRSKWEGYFTALTPGAVVKGVFNSLALAAMQGGAAAGTDGAAAYYTSWLRVNSVNQAANTIEAQLYPDDDTPAGKNYPPCAMMKLARWGHQTDEARQTCLYLSSTEGRIVKLKGVDRPIVGEANVAASFGTVPEFVRAYLAERGFRVGEKEDVLFADSIAVRNIYYFPKGDGTLPEKIVDCGAWQAGGLYYHKAVNPAGEEGVWETSDAWHCGCRWRCMRNLTTAEPRWDSTDWAMMEGNPFFSIRFAEPEQLYEAGEAFRCPLTIIGTLYNQDVTAAIADADVQWTRRTWREDGTERVADDSLWAYDFARSGRSGKAVVLNWEDIGADSGGIPKKIVFYATATLADGMTDTATLEI